MKKTILAVLVLVLLCGCGKEYTKGTLDRLKYTNQFFGFQMEFDEDLYHVYSIQEMAEVLGTTALELSENGSLASTYEFMISTEENTPLFQFYVEHYKFTTVATYDNFISELVYQFSHHESILYNIGTVEDLDLNGVTCKKIPMSTDAGLFVLYQDLYLFKQDGYVGTLMITYVDTYEDKVNTVLKTIRKIE